MNRLPAEAEPVEHSRSERRGDDVGPAHEIEDHAAAVGCVHVDRHAELVGVGALEAARALGVWIRELIGRDHAQRVDVLARFDVDHRRAVVGEHARRAGAREHPEEVEHSEARERQRAALAGSARGLRERERLGADRRAPGVVLPMRARRA
jgi:hypothetical protein